MWISNCFRHNVTPNAINLVYKYWINWNWRLRPRIILRCVLLFYQSPTLLNFLPSTGICFMMSSELKMGSRYSHDSWHLSHASKISCMLNSLSSHSFISSSNGLMYAELWITIHNSNWCKDNKAYIHQFLQNLFLEIPYKPMHSLSFQNMII